MKKRHALLLFFLLRLTAPLPAQSCLPDGITFSTQAQVDQFPALYPGCTTIEGDVFVRTADVTNLDSLIGLTSIGGYLYIDANLVSLHGLDSLESIGGGFWMLATSVQDLSGLNKQSGFVAHRLGRNQIDIAQPLQGFST